MRPASIAFVLIALLASCATVAEMGSSIGPVTLNASPGSYDGATVTVYGYMQSEFENRAIWQDKAAHAAGNWQRDCVSLLIPQSMETSSFHGAYVVLHGRFLRRLPPNVVSLGGCNTTTLELLEPPILARRSWSNNSFKPKPLRGSA